MVDQAMAAADFGELDVGLVKSRFAVVAEHWRLDRAETAALLGIATSAAIDADPLETVLSVDSETRLRLAIEVARGLDRIFDTHVLLDWLRDDEDDDVTPLAFMSRGVTELRAMRAAAAARVS